jgi:hypothetical protein
VTLALTDRAGNVWVSEQRGGPESSWSKGDRILHEPSCVTDHGPVGATYITDQGDFAYAYLDTNNLMRLRSRDDKENWQSTLVNIESGTTCGSLPVDRVGVIVTNKSNRQSPFSGELITISCDNETYASVNGTLLYFSKLSSHTILTDGNGCVWMMADNKDSLAVPVFTISSGAGKFDEHIIVRLDGMPRNTRQQPQRKISEPQGTNRAITFSTKR